MLVLYEIKAISYKNIKFLLKIQKTENTLFGYSYYEKNHIYIVFGIYICFKYYCTEMTNLVDLSFFIYQLLQLGEMSLFPQFCLKVLLQLVQNLPIIDKQFLVCQCHNR